MTEIICQYRHLINGQPVCQIVAEIVEQPLAQCHVNDSACTYCLGLSVPPQTPNVVTASMAIAAARRTNDPAFERATLARMSPHLIQVAAAPKATVESLPCIKRGLQTREQACKPCQADSLVPVMVPVYACHEHNECTLNNTGSHPKIHACATCEQRLPRSHQLSGQAVPLDVLEALPQGRSVITPMPSR